jgi:molybdenum cofactor cytidylyltransferase
MGADNKLLLEAGGATLVRASVQSALASNVQSTIVVLGHQAQDVAAALEGLEYQGVINEDYAEGMASSLRVGVAAAERYDAVMVLLADMPRIEPRTIDALLREFARREEPAIVVATHKGRRGHPVIWPVKLFPDLMTLRGDVGGKGLLEKYARHLVEVDVSTDSIFTDIDTVDDLAATNTPSSQVN